MVQPTRVVIVDDSAPARHALRALLSTWPELTIVGEAANGEQAIQQVTQHLPDIVLMDLHMPVLDGVQATRHIKQQWPEITVVVLTMYITEQNAALAAGADAFVLKGRDPERLLNALGVSATGGGA